MNSGAYQITFLVENDIEISVGRLGLCCFKKGIYIYTGSAMKNLSQRVSRHLSNNKKIKWHIDYLLANSNCKILKAELFYSGIREECQINQRSLDELNAVIPVKGFGSSDCSRCESHLIFMPDSP